MLVIIRPGRVRPTWYLSFCSAAVRCRQMGITHIFWVKAETSRRENLRANRRRIALRVLVAGSVSGIEAAIVRSKSLRNAAFPNLLLG